MKSLPSADVCVLIPCYNNLEGLKRSINSIQYNKNLHILVVDDGSVQPIEASDIKSPFPITVVRLRANAGITAAMNAGLQWIAAHLDTKYVARLDCGDVCTEDRFIRQAEYLDLHPETGLVASWCTFENKKGDILYIYTTPEFHKDILSALPYRNVFIHPTVMFRFSLLGQTGLYSYDYPHAEDYELFWKMTLISEAYIFPQALVTCEFNPKGISMHYRKKQLRSRLMIVKKFSSGIPKLKGIVKMMLLMVTPYSWVIKLKSKKRFDTCNA